MNPPGSGRGNRFVTGREQLFPEDEEERLPWLEEGEEPETGIDGRRIVIASLIALLVVGALIAAFVWLLAERSTPDIVADGSTIEAPDEPYKTRPADPGGLEVEGTGAMSFAVAEGQSREGRIVNEAALSGGASAAGDPGGIGVQVGAFATREEAIAGWGRLRARMQSLQGRNHRVLEGSADSGTIYRLQAVAGSRADADALCRAIRAEGGDCQVKR